MTPEMLRRVGELLYGVGKHMPEMLAIDLAVSVRTAQRWVAGQREIPDLEGELAALVHERARELAWLAEQLGNAPAEP